MRSTTTLGYTAQPQPAGTATVTEPPPEPMSVEELHECGEALSWGASAIARAIGIRLATTNRWWAGTRTVPLHIAAHIRLLADFHRANPFPPPPPYMKVQSCEDADESASC